MVAQNTVRTHGVNPVFRFVEGIRLHRKRRQIQFSIRKRPIFLHACATCSELPSNASTMMLGTMCMSELIFNPHGPELFLQ